MSFEEFRIPKRGENDCSYTDWQEWLEKRGISMRDADPIERGGKNLTFVCWGSVTDLRIWPASSMERNRKHRKAAK